MVTLCAAGSGHAFRMPYLQGCHLRMRCPGLRGIAFWLVVPCLFGTTPFFAQQLHWIEPLDTAITAKNVEGKGRVVQKHGLVFAGIGKDQKAIWGPPREFRKGRFEANGKVGWLLSNGQPGIPALYDKVAKVAGFFELTQNGLTAVADSNHHLIFPFTKIRYSTNKNNREIGIVKSLDSFYLIDQSGQLTFAKGYRNLTKGLGSQFIGNTGFGEVLLDEHLKPLCGAAQIEPLYSDDLYWLSLGGKVGYADKNAAVVCPIDYQNIPGPSLTYHYLQRNDSLFYFDGSNAPYPIPQVRGKFTLLEAQVLKVKTQTDTARYFWLNKEMAHPLDADYLQPYVHNQMRAAKKGGKFGFLNIATNQWVLPPEYDRVYGKLPLGYAIVERDGRFGLVDSLGRFTLPIQYAKISFLLLAPKAVKVTDPSLGSQPVFFTLTGKQLPSNVVDVGSVSWFNKKGWLFASDAKYLRGIFDERTGEEIFPISIRSTTYLPDKYLLVCTEAGCGILKVE